jgi:hemoglobin/transferrin/lactoferrin receptor protein
MKKITYILLITFSATKFYGQNENKKDSTFKNIELNEVIISVNKIEERKNRVSQQIQVIDAKQIQFANAQSSADLLATSGNVAIQKSQQGGGSPIIRGFEASRILLVIDGVRMNNAIYRSGHLQNIITVDNGMLDRVEILFGPASTVYGSDALGGAIQFFTKNPKLSVDTNVLFKLNAMVRFGTVNNEKTSHIDFNVSNKKFGSLTSITFSMFGDLKMGKQINPTYNKPFGVRNFYVERQNNEDVLIKNNKNYVQKFSGFNQIDFLQKLMYKPTEKKTHLINIQNSTSSDIPRYDRLTDPNLEYGLNIAEWYYGPQKRFLTSYEFSEFEFLNKIDKLSFGVNYQNIEESRNSRNFNSNNLTKRVEKLNVVGYHLEIFKKVKKSDVRAGVDGQFNVLKSVANKIDINSGKTMPTDTRYPDGNNFMRNSSLYFTHTLQINPKWILNDGIRIGTSALNSTIEDNSFKNLPYNSINQTNFVYSGNIGIIYNPTEKWKLSLMTSSGFRVPNIDDLSKIFDSEPGTVIVPNENLKPEKTVNLDLGISKVFYENVRWENTFFYTKFIDAIVSDKFTFNGKDSIDYDGKFSAVIANQNKNKAYLYGFSSILNVEIENHYFASASLNYTYGRVKTDTSDYPLDHIAPLFGRAEIGYKNDKLVCSLLANFNGWKKIEDYNIAGGEDNEQYATEKGMPSWYTITIKSSYTVNKNFAIQAGVENIFDLQYRTFASGINAPGRNIYGTLRFNF